MTKLWVLSDLHQEFCREPDIFTDLETAFNPEAPVPDDFDAIVLAGDVDVHLENSLNWIADRFSRYGKPILYVPGNHDYYTTEGDTDQFTMEEMKVRGWDLSQYLGITLMIADTVVIGDTRIVGTTLWSDFQSVGPGNIRAKEHQAAGRQGMNDYKRIKRASSVDPTKRKRLRPEDTIREHHASRAYIEQVLSEEHDCPTVVVSHHAPHPQSLDPKFAELNYCYASNLQLLLQEDNAPDLWLHGHIHQPVDYVVGKTRIVSNPRGYAFDPQDASNGFNPSLVIEVPEPAPKYRP